MDWPAAKTEAAHSQEAGHGGTKGREACFGTELKNSDQFRTERSNSAWGQVPWQGNDPSENPMAPSYFKN